MLHFLEQSKVLIISIISGVLPAIVWLWFWFREEDDQDREPVGLIILTFILGGLLVFIAIWMEKYSANFISSSTIQIIVWATIEELLKLIGVMLILKSTNVINEPIDYPMYFITIALGFAAFENVLYLMEPFKIDGSTVGLLTGNLRFLGSTLLHAIASSMIGTALGLSFYLDKYRTRYLLIGISMAILLHSIFNFFIIKGGGKNFLSVFGFLWVVAIINILIFEKLRRMRTNIPIHITQ